MNKSLSTYLSIAAALVGLGIVAYHFFAPMPSANVRVNARLNEKHKLEQDRDQARSDVTKLRTDSDIHLWKVPTDQIAVSALADVTDLAILHQLKLVSFRPQRIIEDDGVQRVPYLANLQGPFPNVIAFINDLETSEEKLAVNSVQIASADGATSLVSASVGIVGYQEHTKTTTKK